MLTDNKVQNLINHSTEIGILDFKKQLPDVTHNEEKAELIRDIIAIANSAFDIGEISGYLIFGVEDKTRTCHDISRQVLVLKPKEVHRVAGLSEQNEVDAFNQRNLVKLSNDYITGYPKRNLRLDYSTWEHPVKQGAIIGILELYPINGPYTVKKPVHKLDSEGKTVEDLIKKGQAWIREGEDKRQLEPDEIIFMRESAKQKRRQARRIRKAEKELRDISKRWDVSIFARVRGETPKTTLIDQPLITVKQLEKCFIEPPQLVGILDDLGEDWHLNHLIISSPRRSGRTTLLMHLLSKVVNLEQAITLQIHEFPSNPEGSEFVVYLQKILEIDISKDDVNMLIIDLPRSEANHLDLIQLLGDILPNTFVWITCDPGKEGVLKEGLSNSFTTGPVLIRLPGYLDINSNFFSDLIDSIFDNPENIKSIMKEKVVFNDIVMMYNLQKRGIDITEEFRTTQKNQLILSYGQLPISVQQLVKLIAHHGGLRETEFRFLASAFESPLGVLEDLLSTGLIYIDETKYFPIITVVEDLPNDYLMITDQDLFYIAQSISRLNLGNLGVDWWRFSILLENLRDIAASPSLVDEIGFLIRRLNRENYCYDCDAFFPRSIEYCPNCGAKGSRKTKKQKRGQRDESENIPVPFPNVKLIQQGTYKTSRGVDSESVEILNNSLPEPPCDL
jgi:hypothetical protein